MVIKVDGYDLFEGHTPGPWRWDDEYKGCRTELMGPNYDTVASAEDRSGYPYTDAAIEISRADAELIAAAPDLLAERNQLREALESGYMIVRGKAHIRSKKDIPMPIPDAKRERLIRNALRGVPHG